MDITIDTSAIIAVISRESQRERLIEATVGAELVAPKSVHWEIGNAFSAMFRRGRCTLEQARACLGAYGSIPLRFVEVELEAAVALSQQLGIYAYDAYLLECALRTNSRLLTLDTALRDAALRIGVRLVEV